MKKVRWILGVIFIILFLEISLRIFKPSILIDNNRYNLITNVYTSDSSVIDVDKNVLKNVFIRQFGSDSSLSFEETIDNAGNRITKPIREYRFYDSLDKVIFLGCSYTFGDKVNDSNTALYLLQKENHEMDIINSGSSGFGASKAYYILDKTFKKDIDKKIKYVFYNYGSFHYIRDFKNQYYISSRNKIVSVVNIYKDSIHLKTIQIKPTNYYFSAIRNGCVKVFYYAPDNTINSFYSNLIYKNSYLLHCLSNIYARVELNIINNKLRMSSKELIKEMNRLCLQHGTSFYCCMLTNDKETDDVVVYCKQNSINFYQYKVDLFCADNTFLPIDPHPNNEGHKKMFREIDSLLKVIHYDKK